MQLSKRLHAVASLVTPNSKVADVGCDHAYTSIYLVENHISPKVIAMDVNQGPIERAKANIIKYGYETRIEVRKSDGLEKLKEKEADTIIIAGMGGGLTNQILTNRMEVVKTVSELILQPQSEIHLVRKMLSNYDFLITAENMIKEDGKYYVMMKAESKTYAKQLISYELLNEEHIHFGRHLLEHKHPVLKEFLLRERSLCENIYETLKSEMTDNSISRQKEIQVKLERIDKALDYFI